MNFIEKSECLSGHSSFSNKKTITLKAMILPESVFYPRAWNTISETYLCQVSLLASVIFVCNGQDTSSPNVGPLVWTEIVIQRRPLLDIRLSNCKSLSLFFGDSYPAATSHSAEILVPPYTYCCVTTVTVVFMGEAAVYVSNFVRGYLLIVTINAWGDNWLYLRS